MYYVDESSHLAGNKLEEESHVADKLANSLPDIILEQNNNNNGR